VRPQPALSYVDSCSIPTDGTLPKIGKIGGRSRTRTYDPLIKSQLLYHLSYAPVRPACESGGQLGLPPYQRPRALSMEALSPWMPCLGFLAKMVRPAIETSAGAS
jgi:hypothetical protein